MSGLSVAEAAALAVLNAPIDLNGLAKLPSSIAEAESLLMYQTFGCTSIVTVAEFDDRFGEPLSLVW